MNRAIALEKFQFDHVVESFINQGDYRMASLAMLAGKALRVSDLLAMNIETVFDPEGLVRPVVRLKEEKTGHYREIPIWKDGTEKLFEVLSRFYCRSLEGLNRSGPLFTNSKQKTRMTRAGVHFLLNQFKGEAKIESISSHSIRKCAGRYLHNECGFDIETISEIYAHTSVATTRTYLSIAPMEVRRAWDNLMW